MAIRDHVLVEAVKNGAGDFLLAATRLTALLCGDEEWAKLVVAHGALPHLQALLFSRDVRVVRAASQAPL